MNVESLAQHTVSLNVIAFCLLIIVAFYIVYLASIVFKLNWNKCERSAIGEKWIRLT